MFDRMLIGIYKKAFLKPFYATDHPYRSSFADFKVHFWLGKKFLEAYNEY